MGTPGPGSSNQSTTSSSHGGSDSYPDLNNDERASRWRQDCNAGDPDTSGSSDGELHGLQRGNGAKREESFKGICHNCGKSGSSVTQRVEKQKERDREERETAKIGESKGWTVGKRWSDSEGWNSSGKDWEQQRPPRINNLERDQKQYDVLVMEASTQEKTVRVTGVFPSNTLPNSAAGEDRHQPRQTSNSLLTQGKSKTMTQHQIVWDQDSRLGRRCQSQMQLL